MKRDELNLGAILGWNSESVSDNPLGFQAEILKETLNEILGNEGRLPDELVSALKDQLGYETKGISSGQLENERANLVDLLNEPEAMGIVTGFLQEKYRLSYDNAVLFAKALLKLLGEEPTKRKPRKKPSSSSKKTARDSVSARKKKAASSTQKKGKTSSSKRRTASSAGKKTASTVAKKSAASKADRTATSKKSSSSTASKKSGSSRTGKSKPSGRTSASKTGKPRPSSKTRLQTTETASE